MRKQLIIVGVRKNTELIIINPIDKLLDFEDYKKETTFTDFLVKF